VFDKPIKIQICQPHWWCNG